MSRAPRMWVTVVGVSLLIAGCSKAERSGTRKPDQPSRPSVAVGTGGAGANIKTDGDFVHDVATKNIAEIELSRIAREKANSPAIKAFAQKLIDDHDAAGNKLKNIADGAIEWPAQVED